MQDRPDLREMLEALEEFMRTCSSEAKDRYDRFQFLVAANSLKILQREVQMDDAFMREEWAGLDALLAPEEPPVEAPAFARRLQDRNEELSAQIQLGAFDGDQEPQLVKHLYQTVVNKVRIASPKELKDRQ